MLETTQSESKVVSVISVFNLCLDHLMLQTKRVLSQTVRQSFCRRGEDCFAFCEQDGNWLYLLATGIGTIVKDGQVTNLCRSYENIASDVGISKIRTTALRVRRFLYRNELSKLELMHIESNRVLGDGRRESRGRIPMLFVSGNHVRKAIIKLFYPTPSTKLI
ncbi:hypothetical protein Corgl_1126 [Coriobacterium glomerans PW2]|uniref:Uncharacterized protein n=1 Tax=Coriobacterium glomerans (strain ATCC 49209 / DSM 20642 / JCM 10262 / PW2) TaxID=700015 RepID=F2N849_CORGP|nr:hypothetical protein Corgl_1126 [Coriobacterium glomerans PW2]